MITVRNLDTQETLPSQCEKDLLDFATQCAKILRLEGWNIVILALPCPIPMAGALCQFDDDAKNALILLENAPANHKALVWHELCEILDGELNLGLDEDESHRLAAWLTKVIKI